MADLINGLYLFQRSNDFNFSIYFPKVHNLCIKTTALYMRKLKEVIDQIFPTFLDWEPQSITPQG